MTEDNHLKIGFVLDDSLDKTDGVQQYVLTLGRYFASQGHDVHYLVGETTRTDLPNVHSLSRNVRVRFNRNRMSMPLPVPYKTIRRLLAEEAFDILHIQMPYSPFLAGRLIKSAAPQTGVVGTFHVAPHSRLVTAANWMLRWFIDTSIRRFDEIMSVSTVAQDFAWRTFGIESALVPNCASLQEFFEAKSLKAYRHVPTVVFLGRLVERKGCMHLLRAIQHIRATQLVKREYKVLVCGAGPLEQSLKDFVREHELEHVVTFTGYIEEADKPGYLASADVAVFPSTGGESFGIVLLEAMAAARGAVIAGNNPGYASVMASRPDALFDPFNTEQLATSIAGLLSDDQRRQEIHDWQRSYVTKFDVANVADEVQTLYDSALHKRRE
jgi:phosphatidylinositol alpha-mannosyltransferase